MLLKNSSRTLLLMSFVSLLTVGCAEQVPDYSGRFFQGEPLSEIEVEANESWATFNSEKTRLVFGTHNESWTNHALFESVQTASGWSSPTLLPFSGQFNDRGVRFYPALDALLFSSDRPVVGGSASGDFNLWIAMHDGQEWMAPEALTTVNTDANDMHGSVSETGSIYFASDREGGMGQFDLYRAKLGMDGYEVEALSGEVNSTYSESDVYVDGLERYLIFSRADDPIGMGGDDLFISFRDGDDWSTPQHLGPEVNTENLEYGAEVSRDGRLLYYTSHGAEKADILSVLITSLQIEWPQ